MSDEAFELDLIYVQDAGLKPVNAGLINEYYVSQYLERRILEDKIFGAVACCRQNMKESTGHPWFMMACKNTARVRQCGRHAVLWQDLPGNRHSGRDAGGNLGGDYAGESSVFALQEKPFSLAAGGVHKSIFVGTYLPDHPQATSEDDLNCLPGLMLEFE